MFRYSRNHQHEPPSERRPIRVRSRKLPRVQLFLCIIGVGSFVSAFSAGAEFFQMNASVAHANHPDRDSGQGATLMAQNGSYVEKYERTATMTSITDATKPANVITRGQAAAAEPNTGILILGGLALLLWIQRFRRNRI